LIEGFLAGDDHAFAELFGKYRPQLFGYFLNHFHDFEKAEDLTGEVIARVLEELKAHLYHEEGKCRGWIFGHAHNVMKEEMRRLKRHPEHMHTEADEQ